jgi:formiminotetrahydrofolate cyclodeaminase
MAAYLAATGAALASMAFRFSTGEKYAAVAAAMHERVAALESVRARALELVDADSASYDAVSAAYKLPKASAEEQARRRAAVQAALRHALELPYETMERALDALRIALTGVEGANRNLASDLEAGALCLWSAVEAAHGNVAINASSLDEREWADTRLRAAHAMRVEARTLLEELRGALGREPM